MYIHICTPQLVILYMYICLGMADNGSECVMTDAHIRITNIVYTSLSLLSLITGLIALFLNQCYNCHHKKHRRQIDPMENIFLIVLITCCMFELSDCFQWFALFHDFVGCNVLGAVREYTIISLLVILTSLGTHLLILMTQPKCLQVIKEVKLKRYQIIHRIYLIASFLVPILFVPWPFTSTQYGKDGYVCWLRGFNCGTGGVSNVLSHLLMWYVWAVFAWLFAVAVFVLSFYKYCVHRRNAVTKWRPDINISTIISILTVFIVQVVTSVLLLMWGWIKNQPPFATTVLVAVLIPLMLMIFFIILIIRQVVIIRAENIGVALSETILVASYNSNSVNEPNSTSSTFFILPKDEWDEEEVKSN